MQAVHRSYTVSKKYRVMMQHARKHGNQGDRIVATIEHHRPFYRLKYILHDEHAYPMLMRHLEREYSSENALFCLEVEKFHTFCRMLERATPGWNIHIDDEVEVRAISSASTPQNYSTPILGPVLHISSNHIPSSPSLPFPRKIMSNSFCRDDPIESSPNKRRIDTVLTQAPSPSLPYLPVHHVTLSPSDARKTTFIRVKEQTPIMNTNTQHPGMIISISTTTTTTSGSFTQPTQLPVATGALVHPQLLTVREMHQHATKARAWCMRLYDEYLKPNALYQVNIDSDLTKMVVSHVNQLSTWHPTPIDSTGKPDIESSASPLPPPFPLSSLYRLAALSVFNLLEADSFRRFLLTTEFQLLLQEADNKELQHLGKDVGMDTKDILQKADDALIKPADEYKTVAVLSHSARELL